ncbi:MAG: DNA polymerase IV [Bacteriovoracaceae bacterium]
MYSTPFSDPMPKKIIHIDMDCFFAAVEMRDQPELKNIPLAIGGKGPRSVLSTCNYLARKFGIRSAMSSVYALRLCPGLTIIPGNMEKYLRESQVIQSIFHTFTSKVQTLGLDEAYLDVSDSKKFNGSATLLAKEIKKQIYAQTKLTSSAGVAPNKFLAKVASDWKKPDGLFVIRPEDVESFIKELPVEKINGVGKVTAQKLKKLGLYKCQDVRSLGEQDLIKYFGKFGKRLYDLSCGIDQSEIQNKTERKSLSVERTFETDLITMEEMKDMTETLFPIFHKRLMGHIEKKGFKNHPKGIFLKLRFNDFKTVTTQMSMSWNPNLSALRYQDLREQLEKLLRMAYERGKRPIRLLGLGVYFEHGPSQLKLL